MPSAHDLHNCLPDARRTGTSHSWHALCATKMHMNIIAIVCSYNCEASEMNE